MSTHTTHLLAAQQSERFKQIADLLSPPDPWTNHASARQLHEPQTGAWLLQSDQFRRWKAGSVKPLWIYGKAGCGKTVLCSTAIDDILIHCDNATNAGLAMFYFSFSDDRKQSHDNFLRSLVTQLGWEEPGLSMLQQTFGRLHQSSPGAEDLEDILLSSVKSYDEVYLLLDALDECPKSDEMRQNVLERLEWLSRSASNVRILATSRELRNMREWMEMLEANTVSIAVRAVNVDIRTYVSSELARDRRLGRLDAAMKASIEESISQRADGM